MIGHLDKAIRALVLIMPKMSGDVETGINKLMSSRVEDEKLLEKYKTIWTKIEDLKYIRLDTLTVYDDWQIYKNQNKNIWW